MSAIEQIRTGGERKLDRALASLDKRHRALLIAALEKYGSVAAIPEPVWRDIQRDQENETAAVIILLMLAGDEWTTDLIGRQGVATVSAADAAYSLDGVRQAQETAAATTATVRDRLARKVQDAALTGPGATGELTPAGIRAAVDEVYIPARRKVIATDTTTGALSRGQLGAAKRIGGDGAATIAGQRVRIELIWRNHPEDSASGPCPRCAPLDGQPEKVWGLVFPNGPGQEAHVGCVCSLEPQVVELTVTDEKPRDDKSDEQAQEEKRTEPEKPAESA